MGGMKMEFSKIPSSERHNPGKTHCFYDADVKQEFTVKWSVFHNCYKADKNYFLGLLTDEDLKKECRMYMRTIDG